MAIPLQISGTTYQYPSNRQSPGWGEEASAWAQAVTDAINGLIGVGDIPTTSATILNGQGVANIYQNNTTGCANVVGLLFDPTVIRGATVEYTIFRTSKPTGSPPFVPYAEKGTLEVVYDGANWTLLRGMATSDIGVELQINSAGQILYRSTTLAGNGYSAQIKFKAVALTQA